MRNYEKLLNSIEKYPESTNEFLLNSSGEEPGMSQEKLALENRALTAVRKADPEIRRILLACTRNTAERG